MCCHKYKISAVHIIYLNNITEQRLNYIINKRSIINKHLNYFICMFESKEVWRIYVVTVAVCIYSTFNDLQFMKQ